MFITVLKNFLFSLKRTNHPSSTEKEPSAGSRAAPCEFELSSSPVIDGTNLIEQGDAGIQEQKINTTCNEDIEAQRSDSNVSTNEKTIQKCKKFIPTQQMISDATLGLSDGLTVPFALTAGLSSLGNTRLVILGGLAELISGAISMGLGGYFGAAVEKAAYKAKVESTQILIRDCHDKAMALAESVFDSFDFPSSVSHEISATLQLSDSHLSNYLMRFHFQMQEPENSRPYFCAITIGLSYFAGGLVPLLPYFCVRQHEVLVALWWSIGIMVIALFAFGWAKTGIVEGWHGKQKILSCVKGGVQMVVVGGVAAAAAVGIVRAINH